ncbi:transmembrane protein 116 isoform X2 [Anolis sagrei]|uniref:transmembrane protein 116 isoform X2 n=1 Tax=Anolis sagrei TaxID=38937 RepID=UPI00351FCEDC
MASLVPLPLAPWPQFFAVIHWIQAITASLSVIGSSSMIGYAIFQNTARSPEGRPLFYLSLSDLLLAVCWLAGALLYSQEATEPNHWEAACYNLQTTGQIFSYTNRMGRVAIILSGIIPFLIMLPVLGMGNHDECYQNFTMKHGCLLMHTELGSPQRPPCSTLYFYSIGVFLVSYAASFLVILVLLIRARALYKRFVSATGYVGDQQWAMIKMVEQGVILYPVVFFCCWGPAFILGVVKVTSVNNISLYMVLWVLEALTASSQGLLNCAVYGWTQHMFRCMKRKACRDVDTQTPLLRSQKRFYASTLPAEPQGGAKAASTVL